MGETGKDLYGTDGSTKVSRLTYKGLRGTSGEVFGQINERNYFVKGVAGIGALLRGTLQDEDFPPAVSPYSSTDSGLHGGNIGYLTIDGGGYFAETPNARLGVFAGYGYLRQSMSAYGCTQTASNPAICATPISDSTRVITQTNNWNALRLGMNGEMEFGKGWRLKGEAAALPLVMLNGTDFHWLRIGSDFTGGIPEDGTGWGYQLEAMLDYTLANRVTVGVGARYWHMQTRGNTHFENHIVVGGGSPQRVDWKTDYFGLTAHAAWQY
jgi:outer membrane protease